MSERKLYSAGFPVINNRRKFNHWKKQEKVKQIAISQAFDKVEIVLAVKGNQGLDK